MLTKLSLFGAIGVINTAVDWGIFWLLGTVWNKAHGFVWFAKAFSYGCAVCSSFILNSRLTFAKERFILLNRQRGSALLLFARFVSVGSLCLVVNSAMYASVRGTAYWDWFGLLAATATSFALGFFLNQRWTYAVREPYVE